MSLYDLERCVTCAHARHAHTRHVRDVNGVLRRHGCRRHVDELGTCCACVDFTEPKRAHATPSTVSGRDADADVDVDHGADHGADHIVDGPTGFHREPHVCTCCGEAITDMWVSAVPVERTGLDDVRYYHLGRPLCKESCFAAHRARRAACEPDA